MNSKHEQQDNQPVSAAVENANETRQEQCRIARHRLVPSVSSSEASRHPSRNRAHRFPSLRSFPKHATPVVVYSLTYPRLVPRLVLSRLAGRLVHISDRLSIPYSLYRPVGPCSSGLALPVSSPGVEYDITITTSSSSNISIVFSYPCILVSFIYIAYIIFIIYIYR